MQPASEFLFAGRLMGQGRGVEPFANMLALPRMAAGPRLETGKKESGV